MNTECATNQVHCSNCGSTNEEEVGYEARRSNEGYSDCCNEPVEYWASPSCHNHHAQAK